MEILCGKCAKPKGKGEECCNCGRPTDYSEDILKQTNEYLESCQDEEVEQEKKEGWTTYKIKAKLPTIEGLASYLSIHKDTIYEWCKVHSKFSDLIEELRNDQADRLINSGLSGDYNPTIAKVLLTKHGYREGLDQTTNDKELPTPIYNGQSKAV